MKYPVDLKLEAHQDIFDAKVWYENQREGLGDEFYEEVEKTKELISKNPYSFQVKYKKEIRWVQTNRFPYIIVYIIRKKRIIILTVVSKHQYPLVWKKKTKGNI